MENNEVKIDMSKIPKRDLDSLSRAILKACKKFYSDLKNVEVYEKWKAEQGDKYQD